MENPVEQLGPEYLVHPFGAGYGRGGHANSIAYFPRITLS
jgi:hypothetical protein